jgi:hypothetical protein
MSKTVTVVGATGNQGGSVVRELLGNPAYSIRAITRYSKSDAAKSLASKGVEVVEADVNDLESLKSAFAGSYAIFAVTNFFASFPAVEVEKLMEIETHSGTNMADAAAATESLQHYVWSTLPNSRQKSDGKAVVPYYESKNQVDKHISSIPQLLAKTTFLWLGWYAGNAAVPIFHPSRINTLDGSKLYVQLVGTSPSTLLPMLGDETKNPGVFVKAILDQPQKTLPGKYVAGFVENWTMDENVSAFGSAHGVQARCLQIQKDAYAELYPGWGDLMNKSFAFLEYMGGKSFAGEGVVTKEDLNIQGLSGPAETYASIQLLN